MKLLFEIDKKDYDPNGKPFVRPSSRAIIFVDQKIAVIYSTKNHYYKIPGGGVEPGEDNVAAMIREVKEEVGLTVIPESIKEFGYVHRIQKGKREPVFIQDNYYYLCNVEPEQSEVMLSDAEKQEGFIPCFVTLEEAIKTNEEYVKNNSFDSMIERELRVLLLVQEMKMNQEIYLVPMTEEMYHTYFKEYENDMDLYLDQDAYTSYVYDVEKVNNYIKRQNDLKRKPFGIMYGNDIVGELIIKNIEEHKCATLSIVMKNKKYKDRGFGTQAEKLAVNYVFQDLDIPVLYADAITTNKRSQHVLEKVGFQFIKEENGFKYYCIEKKRGICNER